MSYGGALGSLICFHDNEVYAIKERNGQMSLQRVEIDGWEVPAKVHLGGPHAFKREPTWQFGLRHVDTRRHDQPVSALVRTGDGVLVASCRGIFRIPFDGPAEGEQPEPAIDAPVLVPHGISVAGSQMILTSLDGRVIAME
jgi:hypothetical protein